MDWRAAGLTGFGKPTGYLERQLRRFGGLWEINRTREIPAVERVGAWLAEHLPESGPATHRARRLSPRQHDLRGRRRPRACEAVLDWEMATIGDPLADLGYLCMMWTEGGRPDGRHARVPRRRDPPRGVSHARGADRAATSSARAARWRDLRWYTTLALWKSVVFMEGNYQRALAGATDDPYLKQFGDGVVELARQAEGVALGDD